MVPQNPQMIHMVPLHQHLQMTVMVPLHQLMMDMVPHHDAKDKDNAAEGKIVPKT